MGVAPLEGLTRIAPLDTGAEGRRRLALGGIRGNLVTLFETFRLALDALRAHKLRSFLTLLGVILAVLTLVTVMSVVAGLNFYVADRVANLGANVYVVDRFGIITSEDAWIKAQKRPLVTLEEFEWVRDNMKLASRVAAAGWVTIDIRAGNTLLENTRVKGATADYAELRNIGLASGRYLTEADDLHHSPICFIGTDVAKKFFPNVDPVGKTIRAGTHTYQVVGVAQSIGSAFGQSQDNYMLIPLVTYYKEWHTQQDWLAIFVQAQNTEMMSASQDEARMLMRAVRHLDYNAQRQLRHSRLGLDHGAVETAHRQFVWGRGGVDRRVSGGRRHRDHEHHAGERDRANARNRHASIAGRAKKSHHAPVHDGVSGARRRRRDHRHPAGLRRRGARARRHIHSDARRR